MMLIATTTRRLGISGEVLRAVKLPAWLAGTTRVAADSVLLHRRREARTGGLLSLQFVNRAGPGRR
jgi:hypothetical protein